jgi:hypothetical protein
MNSDGMTVNLSPQEAQRAIYALVSGEPPSLEVVDLISVGLERDIRTFEREYFAPTSFLVDERTAGSSFKVVEAYYGGGKTHYLRAVERSAHRHNFASAFVGLKKDECPLTRFDLIYIAVAESLTVPRGDGNPPVRGLGNALRFWIDSINATSEDVMADIQRRVDEVGNLPLMGLKVALRAAALAYASGDHETFDEALVYLTGGKVTPGLRKIGVLQPIDAKNGSLALRTLAALIRRMGWSGFALILDEGDRSLSIVSSKDRKAASNNLVQLINEAATEGAWPGTLLLYSIPSWQNFSQAFDQNQALIQRTSKTGFPLVPPAPRIVLDERERTDKEKLDFCSKLAGRLNRLYEAAYPGQLPSTDVLTDATSKISRQVVRQIIESTYRRTFVQSYLSALYLIGQGDTLTDVDADAIVNNQMSQLAKSGK